MSMLAKLHTLLVDLVTYPRRRRRRREITAAWDAARERFLDAAADAWQHACEVIDRDIAARVAPLLDVHPGPDDGHQADQPAPDETAWLEAAAERSLRYARLDVPPAPYSERLRVPPYVDPQPIPR